MSQTIDLHNCCQGNRSHLYFTRQIRRQVKEQCPKPEALLPDRCGSDVTVTLSDVERPGNGRQSAEIVYGSNDSCVDIYLQILTALSAFERRSRNFLLPILLSLVPSELDDLFDRFIDRELFHITLVRQVATVVALATGAAHDHTKDAFYIFVTCEKFGGIGADGRPGFESVFSEEVDRHFSLEAHHPQFERFRQTECRDCDIQEMAIDRLSRNTVASNGHIDRNTMARHLPQFELGDVDRKLALYEAMVVKLESTVLEEHRKLQTTYYSQGEGQAPPPPEVSASGQPCGCGGDRLLAKIHTLAPNKFNIELLS